MIIDNQHSFTTKDLDPFDMTISFVYRGFDIWHFNAVVVRKTDIIRAVTYANKIVRDYLRGV